MTHLIFTKRKLQKITVKSVDGNSLTTTEHTGFGLPEWVAPAIKAGDELYLELYKFNDIGGLMKPNGEYLFHRSDDYFTQRLAEYLAESKRKNEKFYEENHEDWARRTILLPFRYRTRLERFLNEDPDNSFRKEPMGWGYELIICELAVLYEEHGFGGGTFETEPEPIKEYARKHGTSGNQHECAKAWAKNQDMKI